VGWVLWGVLVETGGPLPPVGGGRPAVSR